MQCQGASDIIEVTIHGRQTAAPKRWAKYLQHSRNKARLTAFLATQLIEKGKSSLLQGQQLVIGGGFHDSSQAVKITKGRCECVEALVSQQEEADTRVMLHAKHASQHGCKSITIRSPDSDVGILMLYYQQDIRSTQLWFHTGKEKRNRFIPIHAITTKIPVALVKALPGLHALTGCDSNSAFAGMGKVQPLKLLQNNVAKHSRALNLLGETEMPSQEVIDGCTQYVMAIYCVKSKCHDIDSLRYELFCKKQMSNSALPPTTDSLNLHITRANYQTRVWKAALKHTTAIQNPIGAGWEHDDHGSIQPSMMMKDDIPASTLELLTCGCTTFCSRNTCKCRQKELPCIESCRCMAAEECQNPFEMDQRELPGSDSENDDSDESCDDD